jgi:hypothetical protein
MNLRDLKEEDMDLKVWRYMPFTKFISMLTFQAIWFPKLNILQDQFEGTMPAATKTMMESEYQDMKINFPPETHWQFDQMASKNEDDSRELLLVSCWFLDDIESDKMWQEYGNGNEAVAIQSTVRQLFQNIGVPHDKHATHMGRVKYVDHENFMMSSYEANQGHERAFVKDATKFSHEQELRIITLNTKTPYCVKPSGEPYTAIEVQGKNMNNFDQPGLYIRIQFEQLISKIVVSPKAGEWFFLLVKRIIDLNKFKIVVEKSALSKA